MPSVPSWHGDPNRHELAVLTVPVAIVLLLAYVVFTGYGLRRHRRLHRESGVEAKEGWSLAQVALVDARRWRRCSPPS